MSKREISVKRHDVVYNTVIDENTTYEDILTESQDLFPAKVTLAKALNNLHELGEKIKNDIDEVEFLDTINIDAYRVYMRTLSFVFITAVEQLFPDVKVMIEHSISGGTYCILKKDNKTVTIDTKIRDAIISKMREIIEADLQIEKIDCDIETAKDFYLKGGKTDKIEIMEQRGNNQVVVYKLAQTYDSFYGYLLPSTKYVKTFGLEMFNVGLVLVGVDRNDQNKLRNFSFQHKLSRAYTEIEKWADLQGINRVADLNNIIKRGAIGEVCRMIESLQAYKIMEIAQEIHRNNKRIVLIAAPSSSGKTSFAYKLKNSLRVLGVKPVSISMDDYYINRENTPLDENGKPNFEAPEAIDLKKFNEDINSLIHGEEIDKIVFDFKSGKRVYSGEKLHLNSRDPIIIEGIHALNPGMTLGIEDEVKYKIYLSVITQINFDDHNRIHTTDLRLMRRMARDKASRGKSIENTIMEWESVREGEKKYIFPYQEEADVIFNSSFIYEIAALKPILMEELEKIDVNSPANIEALRLISLLRYFTPLEDTSDIVNTSILREFIGGSKIL